MLRKAAGRDTAWGLVDIRVIGLIRGQRRGGGDSGERRNTGKDGLTTNGTNYTNGERFAVQGAYCLVCVFCVFLWRGLRHRRTTLRVVIWVGTARRSV